MPGLPKKYAKMGFKKGWKAYKASKKKTKSKSSPKKTKKVRKIGKSFLSTNTIFKFIRLGALIAPAYQTAKQYGIVGAFTDYAGWNENKNAFDMATLKKAWMPFVMATLVTYGVQKLGGIIRRL